jgi:Spondin_N
MYPRRILRTLMVTLTAALSLCATTYAQRLQVTITNLTSGEVLTPIMVATHMPNVEFFTLGQPASVDLEHMAEAGDLSGLETSLRANPRVWQVIDSGAPLPPGQSVTLTIDAPPAYRNISVGSMLVPTNDGFFALNDEAAPVFRGQTTTYYSPAYDAGTEANDEMCSHIPGPPNACTGEGFNANRDDVNFVHIHSGIHGIGDLSAATYDWRNPVARIVVTRLP